MDTFDRIDAILDDSFGVTVRTVDSKLADELDSLDVVELMMSIEEEFNIEVDDDKARGWATIGDVVKYVDAALADKALQGATA